MASDSTAEQCQMVPSGLLTGIKFDILSGRDMVRIPFFIYIGVKQCYCDA